MWEAVSEKIITLKTITVSAVPKMIPAQASLRPNLNSPCLVRERERRVISNIIHIYIMLFTFDAK